jgi:hypothetical protein
MTRAEKEAKPRFSKSAKPDLETTTSVIKFGEFLKSTSKNSVLMVASNSR